MPKFKFIVAQELVVVTDIEDEQFLCEKIAALIPKIDVCGSNAAKGSYSMKGERTVVIKAEEVPEELRKGLH